MQNLILLHGALGSTDQLEPLKKNLSFQFNIYSFNFPGHGGNEITDQSFRMENFVRSLEDFINENDLAPAQIFGYSMGGYVALCLAIKDPKLICSIVTLGTKLDWNAEIAVKEVAMLNPDKIEAKVPKFADMLKERHAPADWKKVLHHTAGMMKDLGEHPLLIPESFRQIKVPVLLMLGENDNMVTEAETINAAHHIPDAKFVKLKNTPHPIEKINPEIPAAAIRGFFLSATKTQPSILH